MSRSYLSIRTSTAPMVSEASALAEPHSDTDEAPGSPSSEHNSLSSLDTQRTADASPGDELNGQRRPKRCKISREQLSILVKSFDDEPLPNFDQRQALAKMLGMTPRSVQIWFQNRRQRLKPMQPKMVPSCEVPSSSQLPFMRRAHSQGSPQMYGMPGLAAVAGLCNRFSTDMMHQAMAQVPLSQSSASLGSMVHSMQGLHYDVMEPFAATKALLGAGYQPPSSLSLSSRLSQQAPSSCTSTCAATQVASTMSAHPPSKPSASRLYKPSVSSTIPAASATESRKDPQADGLLLLLACAGDNANVGVSPARFSSEQPTVVA